MQDVITTTIATTAIIVSPCKLNGSNKSARGFAKMLTNSIGRMSRTKVLKKFNA
jgi:hypothetical protein